MPLGAPCDGIMAIVDHSNAAHSFIVTAYPALKMTANHCHLVMGVSGLRQWPQTYCKHVYSLPHDYTMSINLSVYASCVAQFVYISACICKCF